MFFVVALCAISAFAQNPGAQSGAPAAHSGTIDGVAIRANAINGSPDEAVAKFIADHLRQPTVADQQELAANQQQTVCRHLKSAISQAAVNRAKAELHISATDQEIADQRQQLNLHAPDPQQSWAWEHERTQALVAGLTAVYDQAQDPQQVYQQMIGPHGITQKEWLPDVYVYRTKEARDKLAQKLNLTPDYYARGLASFDVRYYVEGQKLEAAIDQQIAATDPTFETYLNEYAAKVQHPDPTNPTSTSVVLPHGHLQYLAQARAAWWKAESAKVQVTLSDPTISSRCTGLTDPPPAPFNH